ncbi:DUF1768 domain-containing protein [Chitinophaga silvatica]|uniref:DUF1768 domain-containing protein n=2 Tax=Chitinophaga silvatica TaxID=2282649 RepID=A0A3E1Y2H9_9BACT|nr:DUF1768 domain-containing protein [Chitinophaga silvatica]
MVYNNEWTITQLKEGKELDFLFFWGHTPDKENRVTKSCFSQWWLSDFLVDGILYPTAEHWMMACKAKLFNDRQIFEKILKTPSPSSVKSLGRKVSNFDAGVWDNQKFNMVVEGNYHKFSQHQPLKNFLLNTGNKILVEASPYDSIWGIGMSASHPDINNPENWKGRNLLGYALMVVRDQLKST